MKVKKSEIKITKNNQLYYIDEDLVNYAKKYNSPNNTQTHKKTTSESSKIRKNKSLLSGFFQILFSPILYYFLRR